MTSPVPAPIKHHTPEFEFIALIAMLTALVAMSIDTMLPAIGIMAHQLGAVHENDRQLIVLGFFAGNTLGTLLYGPLSDASGRKRTIFGGLAVYMIGSFMCLAATSFPILILGRIVQGFGAAGPRIVSIAMVRDGAGGAAMARVMSFVMSVFMLVPIFAPSIGQVVLYLGSWRLIFAGLMAMALIVGIWLALRQDETLAVENRVPFTAAKYWHGVKEVVSNPVSFGYTLATGGFFAVFIGYLGTCQQIFAEQYQQGDKFVFWFGGMAVALAFAMLLNGRLVMKWGMRRLSKYALQGFMAVWATMLIACLITGGQPPLLLVGVLFAIWFFCAGFIFGNFNAMALEPMGHIAGMASAISGAVSTLMAITLGGIAGRMYDGTLTPLAAAFVCFSLFVWASTQWAERNRTLPMTSNLQADGGHA